MILCREDRDGVTPFSTHHLRYDGWFERHDAAYISEILAVRALLPWEGKGLEIGVGTGRFAAPLGIKAGLDPSREMLTYAVARRISCVQGKAESLPFRKGAFDYALSVTTICFVDDPEAMLTEARRILKPGGFLVIGFIDRTSAVGAPYLAGQAENVFYREATFYSALEVSRLLEEAGFSKQVWVQTLFRSLEETKQIEPVRSGYGEGAFVVVRASSR
jgi:SAM-dependent methyltransferase